MDKLIEVITLPFTMVNNFITKVIDSVKSLTDTIISWFTNSPSIRITSVSVEHDEKCDAVKPVKPVKKSRKSSKRSSILP